MADKHVVGDHATKGLVLNALKGRSAMTAREMWQELFTGDEKRQIGNGTALVEILQRLKSQGLVVESTRRWCRVSGESTSSWLMVKESDGWLF